jgi:hypothetical protein
VIHKYELTGDQIGWFILDNISSNDTCVAEILKSLNINDTVKHRRLRCLGHIINLGARAFLFGRNPDTFEREVEIAQKYEEEAKEKEIWKNRGPIDKLHNVLVYIRNTLQRREDFEEKVRDEIKKQKDKLATTTWLDEDVGQVIKEPLMVTQDNTTRWNSIFSMIQRAFLFKDPIDLFIKRAPEKPKENSPLPKDDELLTSNWNILARIQDILQPFFD